MTKNTQDWPVFEKLLNGREVYIYGAYVDDVGLSPMISSHYRPTREFIDTRQFKKGFLRGDPVVYTVAEFSETPAALIARHC